MHKWRKLLKFPSQRSKLSNGAPKTVATSLKKTVKFKPSWWRMLLDLDDQRR